MISMTIRKFRQWLTDENAVAAAEFGIIFPVMFTMMVGIWDIGNAILINQKSIAAAQVVVDLIGREENVTDVELESAFDAGELALMPYDATGLKIEVASVQFDASNNPVEVWKEANSGTADTTLVAKTAGLGLSGDGALVVQVSYTYEPLFAGKMATINMQERIFSRGRQTAVVERDS